MKWVGEDVFFRFTKDFIYGTPSVFYVIFTRIELFGVVLFSGGPDYMGKFVSVFSIFVFITFIWPFEEGLIEFISGFN